MTPSQEIALAVAASAVVAAIVIGAVRRRARRIAEAVAYVRGVHYVLSDAPDAAIGELTRAVELNPSASQSSIETYFALGKLFRRKGDLEHAIRLHQNILLRPGLPAESKRQAQLELALDLQRAGMLSRAVEAFEKFLAEAPTHPEALAGLRQVHETARDFEAAAEVQVRVVKSGQGGEAVLAHLLASAARAALGADREHAQKLADGAVQADASSPDALLARAEVLAARGQPQQAAEQLRTLLARTPEAALAAEPLLAKVLPPDEVVAALAGDGPPARWVALGRARARAGDRAGAAEALRQALVQEPGFAPARRDLGALLLGAPLEPGTQPAYEELLRALGRHELELQCDACKQTSSEPGWQCPRCGAWDSLRRAG
ncbi:MAG: tetratricopeptide repeat protein [Deltaproteobacteria bacterium]|nr:tetratricopeptide repeat protein [Deltaproteobacteria bacterium]